MFNKLSQRLLSCESWKHGIVNMPIEATHVLISHKMNVGLPKLEDQRLKRSGVFTGGPISLLNFSETLDDIIIAVRS
jgi:hypothetical protein